MKHKENENNASQNKKYEGQKLHFTYAECFTHYGVFLPFPERLIYILPPYLHLVHYLYVFFVKNVPSKHFDLGIQAIGSWNGCPNFGWRSHFWMDIAGFLDARHKKIGYL
jgi:hypothetical protein